MTFFCIPTLALYFAGDLNAQCIITKSLSVAPRLFVCSYTEAIPRYLHYIHCMYHDIVDVLAT